MLWVWWFNNTVLNKGTAEPEWSRVTLGEKKGLHGLPFLFLWSAMAVVMFWMPCSCECFECWNVLFRLACRTLTYRLPCPCANLRLQLKCSIGKVINIFSRGNRYRDVHKNLKNSCRFPGVERQITASDKCLDCSVTLGWTGNSEYIVLS